MTRLKPLSFAYSPCPNDTFMFQALNAGNVFDIRRHDIDTLNHLALVKTYDLTKLSFPAYFKVKDHYRLLGSGAALGFGCGPLLVCKSSGKQNINRIAVPGKLTTAAMLLRLWAPEISEHVIMPFDKIISAVQAGTVEAGVIIHESRFLYKEPGSTGCQSGLHAIIDLGEWWEQETGLPIPLGAIAARRALGEEIIAELETILRQSIKLARLNPAEAMPYVRAHSQEISDEVITQHIKTYVNDFSLELGVQGRTAIDRLETMAWEKGLLS